MAKKRAKIAASLLLLSCLSGIVLLAEFALKSVLTSQISLSREKVASLDLLISEPKGVIEHLNKRSMGKFIHEGSLTNKVRIEGRHHDNENDYLQLLAGDKNLIVIGDSWGEGIRRENELNNTMRKLLDHKFGAIRFVSTGSWSPLLMTLAIRNRLSKFYKGGVDYAVVIIDQTDIGDDYCRYRPYVYRASDGRLLGVDFSKSEFGGSNRWERHLALGDHRFGILLAISRFMHSMYARMIPDQRFLDYCHYDDLVAWQLGAEKDSAGGSTLHHKNYFLRTLQDLVNEIKAFNQNTSILIVTHDWAQHSLPNLDERRFKRNISTLASLVAGANKNVSSLHVTIADYPLASARIFGYPADLFSHPSEYKTLSRLISAKLIEMAGDR